MNRKRTREIVWAVGILVGFVLVMTLLSQLF